jgi:hypothetical protein
LNPIGKNESSGAKKGYADYDGLKPATGNCQTGRSFKCIVSCKRSQSEDRAKLKHGHQDFSDSQFTTQNTE